MDLNFTNVSAYSSDSKTNLVHKLNFQDKNNILLAGYLEHMINNAVCYAMEKCE